MEDIILVVKVNLSYLLGLFALMGVTEWTVNQVMKKYHFRED